VWWGGGGGGAAPPPPTTDHLKVMISRLRAKLEAAGGPRYIETVRGTGYRLVRPQEALPDRPG
jgi:DNA-binding winged helix-turn-helix (wHTH) protein